MPQTITSTLTLSGITTSIVDTFTVPCSSEISNLPSVSQETAENPSRIPSTSTGLPEPKVASTTSTIVVSSYVASFSTPTTFGTNGKTWTITQPTTLTISDCPCTLTTTYPHVTPSSVQASPENVSEGSNPTAQSSSGQIESGSPAAPASASFAATPTPSSESGTLLASSSNIPNFSESVPSNSAEVSQPQSSAHESNASSPPASTTALQGGDFPSSGQAPPTYSGETEKPSPQGCSTTKTITGDGQTKTITSPIDCPESESGCSTVVTKELSGTTITITSLQPCSSGSPNPEPSPSPSPSLSYSTASQLPVASQEPMSTGSGSGIPEIANAAGKLHIPTTNLKYVLILGLLLV